MVAEQSALRAKAEEEAAVARAAAGGADCPTAADDVAGGALGADGMLVGAAQARRPGARWGDALAVVAAVGFVLAVLAVPWMAME